MTLENAIEYYNHLAERNDYMDFKDEASELRQLAIWLNELKMFRESKPRTGEWIWSGSAHRCSNCNGYTCFAESKPPKFCPNCGARMVRGEQNEEIP